MNCPGGKHRYPDKKAAVSALHAALRPARRHKRPESLKFYHCGKCGGWHLAKREELDFKRTRAERGARRRKFSRRDHAGLTPEGTTATAQPLH